MSVLEQLNNGSLHPAQAQTLLSISRATLYRWLQSFRAKDFDFLTYKINSLLSSRAGLFRTLKSATEIFNQH